MNIHFLVMKNVFQRLIDLKHQGLVFQAHRSDYILIYNIEEPHI